MSQPNASDAGTIAIGGSREVHRFGFGAMRITGSGIWGDLPDRGEAVAVLRRAVELGINFIDTADAYGPDVSELLIAEALSPYPSDLVIATKGGLVRPGPNRWEPDGRPEHLREACEASLRRLGLEQIALYQLHRPDPTVPFADSVGAIAELQREGKIVHVGLSNVTVSQLKEAQGIVPIVSVQNRYNIDDRSSDAVLEQCEAEGIAFLPWAPLNGADSNQRLLSIAESQGVSAIEVALAYLLRRSPAMLLIPGTGSVAHLEGNLMALSLDLSDAEVLSLS